MPSSQFTPGPIPHARPGAGAFVWRTQYDASVTTPECDGYIRPKWAELEPSEGQYTWQQVDAGIARARQFGGLLILGIGRAMIDGANDATPRWYGPTIQNWNDAGFVSAMERLIHAAGERYDGKLLAVEYRPLGMWGEDHSHNATMETRKRLWAAFMAAFPTTPLVTMTDNREGLRYALSLPHAPGIWIRRDSVGMSNSDKSASWFLDPWLDGDIPRDAWKTRMIIGELAGDMHGREGVDKWTQRAVAEPVTVGVSMLGNGNYRDPITSAHRKQVAESMRRLGAALAISRLEWPPALIPGEAFTIDIEIDNLNANTRLYEEWELVLEIAGLTIALGSIGPMIEGQRLSVTQRCPALPAGEHAVRLGLVNSRRAKAYRLANQHPDSDHMLPLGLWRVAGDAGPPDPEPVDRLALLEANYAALVQSHASATARIQALEEWRERVKGAW